MSNFRLINGLQAYSYQIEFQNSNEMKKRSPIYIRCVLFLFSVQKRSRHYLLLKSEWCKSIKNARMSLRKH